MEYLLVSRIVTREAVHHAAKVLELRTQILIGAYVYTLKSQLSWKQGETEQWDQLFLHQTSLANSAQK
jgi:hypothetical protein